MSKEKIVSDALWDQTMRWMAADGRPVPAKIADIAIEALEAAGYRIMRTLPPDYIEGPYPDFERP